MSGIKQLEKRNNCFDSWSKNDFRPAQNNGHFSTDIRVLSEQDDLLSTSSSLMIIFWVEKYLNGRLKHANYVGLWENNGDE